LLKDFLSTLFFLDPDFAELRAKGIDESTKQAIFSFYNDPDLEPSLGEALYPLTGQYAEIVDYIESLANGKKQIGNYAMWHTIAIKTEELSEENPKAAAIVATAAFAAWEGAMGEKLFSQPFTGYHPGWYSFPLILARNAVKGGALWAPKRLVKIASEFIAAAKTAPFDESIRSILTQYLEVSTKIEQDYSEHVADLAYDLREASGTTESPNFRPEMAALLWTLGYVPHAHLMKIDSGIPHYRPSLDMMKIIVDHCMDTMSENSLMQYIWLELKDRPPFNLRDHRELFALINVRFHEKDIHKFDDFSPEPPSRSYAKVIINYFRGGEEKDEASLENINNHAQLLLDRDPVTAVQMRSLLNLVAISGNQQKENWKYLSELAASVLQNFNRISITQNLGRRLDIPFYYLDLENAEHFEEKERIIEAYKCAGIWHWLMLIPPARPLENPAAKAMLEEEDILLRELRGARFIRLLLSLPQHYRRYGVSLDEVLEMKPPEGAQETGDLPKFDPFDQKLAIKELRETAEKLFDLFNRMDAVMPEYASNRKRHIVSVDNFVDLLTGYQKRHD